MSDNSNELIHWSDFTADRIIKAHPDKDTYVLASGITPSGTVHFGNFRETITVDLVARALRKRGKKVRFIFSWDDYDTFRKIPLNLPKQDELKNYMFQPIVDVPDPYETEDCYARYQERKYEMQLEKVGVQVDAIYQADMYRAGKYDESIIKTLKNREAIVEILNKHRSSPLPDSWQPVSIYCGKCNRDDKIKDIKFDGEKTLSYSCEHCGHSGDEVIEKSRRVKLPWRMDWPMRWVFEGVDFEPGGKDHSSEGGSFTTSKEIVKLYGGQAPLYLQYDFVSIKGRGGKMSSSSGDVVTVNDVLEVYEPEMVRWIFASYKTNVDFSVSFDLDVLKMYEDYDKMERLAYGKEEGNEKKVAMAKRVYELSQIYDMPEEMPFQPSFRHLCNILQINELDIDKARPYYNDEIKNDRDERRFRERAERATNWIKNFAPEDFKFSINEKRPEVELNEAQSSLLNTVKNIVETEWETIHDDQELHSKIYEALKAEGLKPQDAFRPFYQILISQDRGPKLAGFMRIIGKEKLLNLL